MKLQWRAVTCSLSREFSHRVSIKTISRFSTHTNKGNRHEIRQITQWVCQSSGQNAKAGPKEKPGVSFSNESWRFYAVLCRLLLGSTKNGVFAKQTPRSVQACQCNDLRRRSAARSLYRIATTSHTALEDLAGDFWPNCKCAVSTSEV